MRFLGIIPIFFSIAAHAFSDEIEASRDGAPSHVSDKASIMVWEDSKYVTKIRGSNEFSCLVWADKKGTYEPSCFNKAAQISVLPVYQFQRAMLEKGISIKDIFTQIEAKAKKGDFPPPEPGAVVYMMSKYNKYYDHFGEKLYDVEPHIMLYSPKIKASSLGFNAENGLPDFYDDFPHLSVIHIHTEMGHQHIKSDTK